MSLFKRKPALPPLSRLRVAVKTSDTPTVREVLGGNPALLNFQDEEGATPLHWAAKLQDLSVVATLVDLGADVHITDKLGYTPKGVAYWYGEFRMGAYTDVCQKIVQRLDAAARKA
jgi:hypothetical protein